MSGELRRATADDHAALVALFEEREGHALEPAAVLRVLHDLDPARCLAWIAWNGDRPLGMTSLELQDLAGPERPRRAGCWMNLFVSPAARGLGFYPKLARAVHAGARELGLDLVWGSVRRDGLASGHERLGYTLVRTCTVLLKPLRPGRLLARARSLPGPLAAAAPVVDVPFAALLAVGRAIGRFGAAAPGCPARPAHALSDEEIEGLLELLVPPTASRAALRSWTAPLLRERLGPRLDGGINQVCFAGRSEAAPTAAIPWRIAERSGIRLGVVLDVLARPADGAAGERAARAALDAVESAARRADCDALLVLDGGLRGNPAALRTPGFVATPESYTIVAWSPEPLAPTDPVWRGELWPFTFLDHDAF